MPLAPAITDLEQLKEHPAVSRLLRWNAGAVAGAKFDRDEMSIYVQKEFIREACALLGRFTRWTVTHVPRDQNKEADKLANRALDEKSSGRV